MADSQELFLKVRTIVVDQLGVAEEDVTNHAEFDADLGADSLDLVELVMAVEEEFELEIPDEDCEKWTKVGDIVDYLVAKIG